MVTDQQPLQSLWRSKRKPSARIERILFRHQDINHFVVWKKGKENPADFLSRHAIPLHKLPQRIAEETNEHQKLLFLLHNTPLFSTAITRERLCEAQLNDTNLTRLRHFIAITSHHTMTPPYENIIDSSASCQLKMTSSTEMTKCSFQRAYSRKPSP